MKVDGWLLDVDYISESGEPVIRMWIKKEDKNILALYRDFEPYFYAVPSNSLNKCIEDINSLQASRYNNKIEPVRIEKAKRKDFGEEIYVIKIVVKHPKHVPTLRDPVRELESVAEVREADIPFANRFVIDAELAPCSKIRVFGENTQPSKSYENIDLCIEAELAEPLREELKSEPPIEKMAFDCEMYNKGSAPDSQKDPVIIISIASTSYGTNLLYADEKKNDGKIIKNFISEIRKIDPDIILTYNGDDFDWPYLRERCKKHEISLNVGRDDSKPKWRGGARRKVSITGRMNVDLYRIAERDLRDVSVMSLEEVSDYLDVVNIDERKKLPPSKIGEYWDDDKLRDELFEYARDDVISTYGISDELLPTQIEFSRMTKQFLDDVTKMGRGRQVEWYLIAEAYGKGELIPNKGEYGKRKSDSYLGGFVLKPKRGLHENVVSLDFSSMYPTLMVAYNISPDTLIPKGKIGEYDEEEYYKAPEVGHAFLKDRKGFFSEILKKLINRRVELKERLDKEESKILDIRQSALKTLTNSFYGYTGWGAARWYRKECAEATTAWGREMIKEAISAAEDRNLEVIYGDTDSIFVKSLNEDEDIIEEVKDLRQKLNEELPLEIEIENLYETIFFTEKKKRYAGLTSNEEIKIRGLEVRRGDWCGLAKEIQKKIIEVILKQRDEDTAVEIVKDTIEKLKNGGISLDKLVISKTLTKEISSYESRQAHVRAAEKAKRQGFEIVPGTKVRFLVTSRGGDTIGDRSIPVSLLDSYEGNMLEVKGRESKYLIDTEYYINNQILPAVSRILNYFGYSNSDLKGEPEQRTFGDFG